MLSGQQVYHTRPLGNLTPTENMGSLGICHYENEEPSCSVPLTPVPSAVLPLHGDEVRKLALRDDVSNINDRVGTLFRGWTRCGTQIKLSQVLPLSDPFERPRRAGGSNPQMRLLTHRDLLASGVAVGSVRAVPFCAPGWGRGSQTAGIHIVQCPAQYRDNALSVNLAEEGLAIGAAVSRDRPTLPQVIDMPCPKGFWPREADGSSPRRFYAYVSAVSLLKPATVVVTSKKSATHWTLKNFASVFPN